MRLALALTIVAVAALSSPAGAGAALPPIKHVWIVMLENESYQDSFAHPEAASFLARTLPSEGELLPNYYAIGHVSLDNYIALVSGQSPNGATQSDCQFYTDLQPGTQGSDGQALGQGCVYPPWVLTIADQLTAASLTWRGYMEDMATPCRHPALNTQDQTQSARKGDQYAARHNPFVYFHSLIDGSACTANDVPLDRLSTDLRSASTTPSYSFITPNLCHDGHDAPCVDGEPGGLTSADQFLRTWVPRITGSPAYRDGGLLIVTFDEASSGLKGSDSSACCGEPAGPNSPDNGAQAPGPGGGRVGAVLLSSYVRAGSVDQTAYNHYALLRSVEDLFGLLHLGYAGRPDVPAFGSDVFNARPGRSPAALRVRVGGVPHACVRRDFTVHVRVSGPGITVVRARVDRRLLRRSGRLSFRVRVPARRLRSGRHRVSARAVAGARSALVSVPFRRCRR